MLDPAILELQGAATKPMAVGAYEGADRTSRELAMWAPPIQSADRDMLSDKEIVDARARDVYRNDALVSGATNARQDSIVGALYTLNLKPETKLLGLDETWEREFQEEVETKFTLWAESPNNWLDAARKNTFTEQVRLAVAMEMLAGEILASVEWIKEPGRTYSTALQMIDPDRLCNPFDAADDANLRRGVVRDRFGAPQGYHIREAHTSDYWSYGGYRWRYIPARKPWGRVQMIHIFDQSRPDQSRGMSDLISAMKEMRITKRYRDVVMQNAVVNATYAAYIESELPSETVFQALGGGEMSSDVIGAYARNYLGSIAEYMKGSKNLQLDGVRIPHLYPGTKFKLQNAGSPGGLGEGFEKSLLRYIAAGLGQSYEEFSNDYSGSNYSTIKAAVAKTFRSAQARKRRTADRFATHGFRLWFEEAINKNTISSLPRNAPNIYEGQNFDAYTSCDWIGAGRGQIDELKETQAAVLRLKYHLSTYEDEMARSGKDWRKTLAQRKREVEAMDEAGLQIDQANSINAASGAPREKDNPSGSADTTGEDANNG